VRFYQPREDLSSFDSSSTKAIVAAATLIVVDKTVDSSAARLDPS